MSEVSRSVFEVVTVPVTLDAFFPGHVRALTEQGWDVHGVASRGPQGAAFESAGGRLHRISISRNISPLRDLIAIRDLVKLFRRSKPSVVHGHTPKGGLLAMIAAKLAMVRIRVYTIHGLAYQTAVGPKKLLLRISERLTVLLATEVHAVGRSVQESATQDGVDPHGKIRLLARGSFGGVDTERFQRTPQLTKRSDAIRRDTAIPLDAAVMGFVGRIAKSKGVDDLLAAWPHLRYLHENLHLLIVGPYETTDPISVDTQRTILTDPRIHAIGWCDDVAPTMAAMDILVLPSHREGFGTVLLEAAALGIPTIGTLETGCRDAIIDRETGILVGVRKPAEIVEAADQLLNDQDLRQTMGRQARRRVERDFRSELLEQSLTARYSELVGGSSASPDLA